MQAKNTQPETGPQPFRSGVRGGPDPHYPDPGVRVPKKKE